MANLKRCRLCGVELNANNKRRSHALTKASFFDQPTIKPGEHLLVMSVGEPGVYDAGHHTWEYALCKDCELKLGRWEDERERFLSSVERPTKEFNEQNYIETTGFDQEAIALACLADLYRCSVFTDDLYRKIDLGKKHSGRIAEILNSGHLRSFTEYPVIMWRYNDQGTIVDEAFQLPYKIRFKDGIVAYETLAPRGWSWMVKVDSRPCELFEKVALGSSENIRTINAGNIRDPQNRRILSGLIKAAYQTIR